MKGLYVDNNESKYYSMATNKPPLNVKLLVKKSVHSFDDCARVVTLDSGISDDVEWHIADLANNGLDLWLFVSEKDESEWSNK